MLKKKAKFKGQKFIKSFKTEVTQQQFDDLTLILEEKFQF